MEIRSNSMKNSLVATEIYPQIIVYSNVFEDVERMSRIVKESFSDLSEPGLLPKPTQWSLFGDYITDINLEFDRESTEFILKDEPVVYNKTQEDQLYFIKETIKGFYTVNTDYLNRFNLKINNDGLEKNIVDKYGPEPLAPWRVIGPSICKYNQNAGNAESKAMKYHSDYIKEPIKTAGFKFVVTTTSYFNDDYEGGELDFAIDNKLIGYKPKAGDLIVFPSGHPEYLTENNNIFLHAVQKCFGGEKYFSRMYWSKYEPASQLWHDRVAEYGLEEWTRVHEELLEEYRKNIQRESIEGAVRIR